MSIIFAVELVSLSVVTPQPKIKKHKENKQTTPKYLKVVNPKVKCEKD